MPEEILQKKLSIKRDLLSIIGQLKHACCAVQPGRTFLRRMINNNNYKIAIEKSFKLVLPVCGR